MTVMESINTRPLLDSETDDTDNDEEIPTNSIHSTALVDDTKPIFKPLEPADHHNIAYYIFYLLGIISLLPWYLFITADDYWMYKFRDPKDKLLLNVPTKRTTLQASFISYVSIASNIPSIIVLVINAACIQKVALGIRMIGSLVTILCLLIITTVCVKIDTDTWQQLFFYMTLTIVVLINMAGSVFLGSLTALIGKFTPNYITAMVGGQALGGIFAALAQIVSLSIGATSEHSAFVYFTIGNVMVLISIFCYLVLAKQAFFKYHVSEKMGVLNKMQNDVRPRIINYKDIYQKIWPYRLAAFSVFFVTIAIYPGVTVLIESEEKGHGYKWNDVYFVPVISYLLFSIGDYIGRILAGYLQTPRKGWLLLLICLLRVAFIPLFILCNAQPREHLPVIFNKDYYYIIAIILFSMSNGYIANLSLLWASRVVEPHEKEIAASIISVFIGAGLVMGSFCSLLFVKYL